LPADMVLIGSILHTDAFQTNHKKCPLSSKNQQ